MQVRAAHPRVRVMGRSPAISIGVATDKAKDIKGPKDPRASSSACPHRARRQHRTEHVSREGRLKPSDVAVIGVGSTAGSLAAFRSGQIDAMSNVEPVMTMLERR